MKRLALNLTAKLITKLTFAVAVVIGGYGVAVGSEDTGDSTMVLTGDLSATYASGDFLLWTPKPREGNTGTAMTSMAPASETPPSIESTVNVVAKAPLDEQGRFRMEVAVDEPRVVYFYVINALGHEGQRYAPVKGQGFILEPGALELIMQPGRSAFVIEGGAYNDVVFNSWKRSEAYLEAEEEQRRLYRPVEGEEEQARRGRVDAASAAQSRMFDIEGEVRAEIATTHPDPLMRRLVIESTWLYGPWVLEALRGLAEMTPDDAWVQERLAQSEAAAARRAKARRIATGTNIIDFTAETLDGESVRLKDVFAETSYVLLEFWASWCGPCRVEIPHMKEAYAEHKASGFEIVSFTIDNDREDWVLASGEEDIPWLNLGMGEDAEAPTAYSVTGVPKNYLVDAGTGEIVATDLRGHHLDVKLEALFAL